MCADCDYEAFMDECDTVSSRAEDLPDAAASFRESVLDKIDGMRQWAADNHHVTDKMLHALDNMRNGVEQWLDR